MSIPTALHVPLLRTARHAVEPVRAPPIRKPRVAQPMARLCVQPMPRSLLRQCAQPMPRPMARSCAQPCTRPVVHAANQWRSETRMQSKAKSRAQPMRNVVTCAHGGADARAAVAQSRQAAGGRPAGWRVARVGSCLRDEKAIRPPRRNPRARPQPATQEDGDTDREGNTYTTLTSLAQTPC